MKILFVLPPCLPTPPVGYGGIEAVAAALLPELEASGVQTVVCTPNGSTVSVTELRQLIEPIYPILTQPYNEVAPIVEQYVADVMHVAATSQVDLIHDFSGMLTTLNTLAAPLSDPNYPPVVHTIHGPLQPFMRTYARLLELHPAEQLTYTAISAAQASAAPASVRDRFRVIHNGLNPSDFRLGAGGERLLVLGRLCRDKGQDRLVRYCARHGLPLDVAGTVAEMSSVEEIEAEAALGAASRAASKADFRLYLSIRHLFDGQLIRFHGNVGGRAKSKLLEQARALVIPNRWAEPFGMVAIEAMASGTPVAAIGSGALPELVRHGVTGHLTETFDELGRYLRSDQVATLDRPAIRRYAIRHFSVRHIAQRYLQLYRSLIAQHKLQQPLAPSRPRRVPAPRAVSKPAQDLLA
ncbi:MAG TPA: glycosyltransferase [Candidatus Saccharimonas sp.]|nr:glycosyltransferase [Candidatus Saccharimonas sp.]